MTTDNTKTPCTSCQYSKQQPLSGRYSMTCTHCCARLIRSARPLKGAQMAMFAAIARHQGAPSRAAVLQAIKAMDAQG
jgi:hypothetical protein